MRKIKNIFHKQLLGLYKTNEVEELDFPVDLSIHTKAPGKWLLIDMETGQRYVGSKVPNKYGKWIRVSD